MKRASRTKNKAIAFLALAGATLFATVGISTAMAPTADASVVDVIFGRDVSNSSQCEHEWNRFYHVGVVGIHCTTYVSDRCYEECPQECVENCPPLDCQGTWRKALPSKCDNGTRYGGRYQTIHGVVWTLCSEDPWCIQNKAGVGCGYYKNGEMLVGNKRATDCANPLNHPDGSHPDTPWPPPVATTTAPRPPATIPDVTDERPERPCSPTYDSCEVDGYSYGALATGWTFGGYGIRFEFFYPGTGNDLSRVRSTVPILISSDLEPPPRPSWCDINWYCRSSDEAVAFFWPAWHPDKTYWYNIAS